MMTDGSVMKMSGNKKLHVLYVAVAHCVTKIVLLSSFPFIKVVLKLVVAFSIHIVAYENLSDNCSK
jgi:hypothetical protein